ncbi:MAG: ATP phosphoribosyltransferase [Elusimicrobiota bacterium]
MQEKNMKKLKMGLPKGTLQKATFEIFAKAGIKIYSNDARAYKPSSNDDELDITLFRAQEIPGYVEQGVLDCGISGYDWICESSAVVKEICELMYAKSGFSPVRWVLAVPENSGIKSAKGLVNKRVATEIVNVAKKYLRKKGVKAEVEFSWGATEVKVPDFVDAIIELTETGNSLRANKLKIIDEVLVSTTRFFANPAAYRNPWKREKMDSIAILLEGALAAQNMVGLKMNCREKDIKKIINILPAMKKPTISKLSLRDWVALEVVLEENEVKKIIPELKRAGAEGIIEYPLNKVIP